jgi:hypothetical protein
LRVWAAVLFVFGAILGNLLPSPVYAQPGNAPAAASKSENSTDASNSCSDLRLQLADLQKKKTAVDRALAGYMVGARDSASPELARKHDQWVAAYDDYQIFLLQRARDAYEWQQIASWFVLFLVTFVVVAGVLFAGYQLYWSLQPFPKHARGAAATGAKSGAGGSGTGPEATAASDFSVGAQGIRITSSTVGVVVLTISLVFLYLFIIHVYPITPVSK